MPRAFLKPASVRWKWSLVLEEQSIPNTATSRSSPCMLRARQHGKQISLIKCPWMPFPHSTLPGSIPVLLLISTQAWTLSIDLLQLRYSSGSWQSRLLSSRNQQIQVARNNFLKSHSYCNALHSTWCFKELMASNRGRRRMYFTRTQEVAGSTSRESWTIVVHSNGWRWKGVNSRATSDPYKWLTIPASYLCTMIPGIYFWTVRDLISSFVVDGKIIFYPWDRCGDEAK